MRDKKKVQQALAKKVAKEAADKIKDAATEVAPLFTIDCATLLLEERSNLSLRSLVQRPLTLTRLALLEDMRP